MINSLVKLGFTVNQSKLLSILLDNKWHMARELEKESGLRQPEVSNSLKSLSLFIDVKSNLRDTKGAPTKSYKMRDIDDFIGTLLKNINADYKEKTACVESLINFTALHEPND